MSKRALNYQQELELIDAYNQGKSAAFLSHLFPISTTNAYNVLKRHRVKIRSCSETSRKYSLNESYFEVVDSPNKAYFLGYLMADGYNNENRNAIELSCSIKDKDILDKLNKLIGSNKPISYVNSNGDESYRIIWCSRKLSKDLCDLGCMQNKSFKIKPPHLSDDLMRHFIRGYFDGDGCISYSYVDKINSFGNCFNGVVNITSTIDMCLFFKEYLKNKLGIHGGISCRHPLHNNNNRTIQFTGNTNITLLMEWMYKDAETYLDRKYNVFLGFKNILKGRKEDMEIIKEERKDLIKIKDIIRSKIERWNTRYFISHGIVKCQSNSYFTPEQAEILRRELDKYGENLAIPKEVIDDEFNKAKSLGFPYHHFTPEYMNKRLRTLTDFEPKFKDGCYSWDGVGTELATYFHPHIFECKKKGQMSALEFFNSEDFRRGIWKIIALYPKISQSRVREICCNEAASSRINNFPPRVMITILKHLFKDKVDILDPCSGFGGRLLGCFSSGLVKKYIGIDLSQPTYLGLLKTRDWLNSIRNFETNISHGNCLNEMDKFRDIDFIFTSPPFLDEEEYIGVEVEKNREKWNNNFVIPFVNKAYAALKNGGKFSFYIEKEYALDFCNAADKCGFKRLEDIKFKLPYRENLRGDTKTFRTLNVIVFDKI